MVNKDINSCKIQIPTLQNEISFCLPTNKLVCVLND